MPEQAEKSRLYGPALITLGVLLPFLAFYLRDISKQADYQNARAFRELRSISVQLESELRSADANLSAVNLIIRQFEGRRRDQIAVPEAAEAASTNPPLAPILEAAAYLRTYLPDGTGFQMVPGKPGAAQPAVIRRELLRLDTPREAVLEARLEGEANLSIQLPVRRLFERSLPAEQRGVFEALLLALDDGTVLVQSPGSRLQITRLGALNQVRSTSRRLTLPGLRPAGTAPGEGEGAAAGGRNEAAFDTASGASRRLEVDASGESYYLFLQPTPIRLPQGNRSFELVVCGLAQKDAFESAKLRTSAINVPLVVLALLVGLTLLWPLLKLHTMSPKERLRKRDVRILVATTLVAVLTITFLFLEVSFAAHFSARADSDLAEISNAIRSNLHTELSAALRSFMGFPPPAAGAGPGPAYYSLRNQPEEVLRRLMEFPSFVHLFSLAGRRQKVKLSPDPIPTPLVELADRDYPLLPALDKSPAMLSEGAELVPFTIQCVFSKNTGQFLPLLARQSPPPAKSLLVMSLPFESLSRPVLPRGTGFAVVNQTGTVQFHSEPFRNLRENFFEESDEPEALLARMSMPDEGGLNLRYGGRQVRAYVSSLSPRVAAGESRAISNLPWSLIVYRDTEHVNSVLYEIGVRFWSKVLLLLLLSLPFAVCWAAWYVLRPGSRTLFLEGRPWPRAHRAPSYLVEVVATAAVFLTAVAVCLWLGGTERGALYIPLALFGLLVLYATLMPLGGERARRWLRRLPLFQRSENWNWLPLSGAYSLRLFFRTLVLAAVPAILLFQITLGEVQHAEETLAHLDLLERLKARQEAVRGELRALLERNRALGADAIGERDAAALFQKWMSFRFGLYDPRAHSASWEIVNTLQPAPESVLTRLVGGSAWDSPGEQPGERRTAAMAARGAPQWRGFFAQDKGNWYPRKAALPLWPVLLPVRGSVPLQRWAMVFGAGLLLLVLPALWVFVIVRRLFALDVEDPPPLAEQTPPDEQNVGELLAKLLAAPPGGRLRRVLYICHPHSGSTHEIHRAWAALPPEQAAGVGILDIARSLAAGGIGEQSLESLGRRCARLAVVLVDNFEARMEVPALRQQKLALLEQCVYANVPHVLVFSSIDPILYLQSLAGQAAQAAALNEELARWIRLMSLFEQRGYTTTFDVAAGYRARLHELSRLMEQRGLPRATRRLLYSAFQAEFGFSPHLQRLGAGFDLAGLPLESGSGCEAQIVSWARQQADGYYRMLWATTTGDERLALYQLAMDDWLNPLNRAAIAHLMRKGIIFRTSGLQSVLQQGGRRLRRGLGLRNAAADGPYRLLSESFRRFILETVEPAEVRSWSAEQGASAWRSLRLGLLSVAGLAAFWLLYVRQDLFDLYFGYALALAGGGAAALRFLFQSVRGGGTRRAAAGGQPGDTIDA